MTGTTSREDVAALVQAALAAADPEPLVREFLARFDLSSFENIFVVGVGKAGGSMALGVEKAFRGTGPVKGTSGAGHEGRITDGLVVVKDGHRVEGLERQVEAAHPIPDGRGIDAARGLLEMAGRAGESDLVICLISGGGSALTALPAPGLSLEDLQLAVGALLKSGADIGEVNAVRKHLTMAAAGRLAEAAYPARLLTLIISDVIGDALDVIASGPTVPDESSFDDALAVLEHYSLMEKLPPAVLTRLQAGASGEVEETPKLGDKFFTRVENHILASNRTALRAAAEAAAGLGYRVMRLEEPVIGEARDAAVRFVALARDEEGTRMDASGTKLRSDAEQKGAQQESRKPFCLLAGGETTVTVTGEGAGGRAQEFTLAAAAAIDGFENITVFAFGTDGTDGFTDAAGAMADGSTVARARGLGLDPASLLRDNDSFTLFSALGDLIVTGPTGTNVNDIYGVLIRP